MKKWVSFISYGVLDLGIVQFGIWAIKHRWCWGLLGIFLAFIGFAFGIIAALDILYLLTQIPQDTEEVESLTWENTFGALPGMILGAVSQVGQGGDGFSESYKRRHITPDERQKLKEIKTYWDSQNKK